MMMMIMSTFMQYDGDGYIDNSIEYFIPADDDEYIDNNEYFYTI